MKLKPLWQQEKVRKRIAARVCQLQPCSESVKNWVPEWLGRFFPIYHPFWPLSGSWFGTFSPHIRNIDMFQRGWKPQTRCVLKHFLLMTRRSLEPSIPWWCSYPNNPPSRFRGLLPRLGGGGARESPSDSAGGAGGDFPGVGLQPMAVSEISIDGSSRLCFHDQCCTIFGVVKSKIKLEYRCT